MRPGPFWPQQPLRRMTSAPPEKPGISQHLQQLLMSRCGYPSSCFIRFNINKPYWVGIRTRNQLILQLRRRNFFSSRANTQQNQTLSTVGYRVSPGSPCVPACVCPTERDEQMRETARLITIALSASRSFV